MKSIGTITKLRDLDILLEHHLFKNELDYDADGEPYLKGAVIGGVVIAWIPRHSKDLASAWYVAKKLQETVSPAKFRHFTEKLDELADGNLIYLTPAHAARLICIATLYVLGVDINPNQTFEA